MDWLKDKKNLPIVVGLAVFVLLAAGGLVAFETGLVGGTQPEAAITPTASPGMSPGSPGASPGGPGMSGSGIRPGMSSSSLGMPQTGMTSAAPGGSRTAAVVPAVPVAPKMVNPGIGPDPFGIPGGQKVLARQINAALIASSASGSYAAGMPLPLREILPRFDLFTIHPPAPPPIVDGPGNDPGSQNYILTGILNSDGGILAILETGGQSQQVKPGDALPDGGKVLSIQTSSVTLRTPGGTTVNIPLSSGAGVTDQMQNGQNGQDPNAGNFPGQPLGQ